MKVQPEDGQINPLFMWIVKENQGHWRPIDYIASKNCLKCKRSKKNCTKVSGSTLSEYWILGTYCNETWCLHQKYTHNVLSCTTLKPRHINDWCGWKVRHIMVASFVHLRTNWPPCTASRWPQQRHCPPHNLHMFYQVLINIIPAHCAQINLTCQHEFCWLL